MKDCFENYVGPFMPVARAISYNKKKEKKKQF